MYKIKKIVMIIIGFILVTTLASCNNSKNNVSVEMNLLGLRTTVVVNARLIDDSRMVTGGTFSVRIFDDNDVQISTTSFDSTLVSLQEHEFRNLKIETTYTVRVFATFNSRSNILDEQTVTTSTVGTEEEPVEIRTVADFLNISKDNSAFFVLKNDIDFEGAEITPMFTQSNQFRGNFQGAGFTVSNFELKQSTANHGVFGYLGTGSVINNVRFSNVELNIQRATDSNVGVLAGYNMGTVTNVVVRGITGRFVSTGSGNMNVGMLIGVNGERGLIDSSHVIDAKIDVTARNRIQLGGFVGVNLLPETGGSRRSIIRNSSSQFEVKLTHSLSTTHEIRLFIGGFVGINQTVIEDSTSEFVFNGSTSKASSSTDVYLVTIGGFVASQAFTALINGCAAVADITYTSNDITTANIGLLVGTVSMQSRIFNTIIIGHHSNLEITIETKLTETETEEDEDGEETTTTINTEFNILVSLLVASHNFKPFEDEEPVNTAYTYGPFSFQLDEDEVRMEEVASISRTDIAGLTFATHVLQFINSKTGA